MNILITNDDGINSYGIRLLYEKTKKIANVFIVAPDKQQSAVGHGITIHEPLEIKKDNKYFTETLSYTVSGKPADCVLVAKNYLKLDFDYVFSGVNDGPNLGTDVLYSGTVAGASEGIVYNVPAAAFSTDFGAFDIVENELDSLIEFIFKNDILKSNIALNINFPINKVAKSKGIKFTTQGKRTFSAKFIHDNGKYWSKGQYLKTENEKDTDVYYAEKGYTTITPISLDRTNYEYLNKLKNLNL